MDEKHLTEIEARAKAFGQTPLHEFGDANQIQQDRCDLIAEVRRLRGASDEKPCLERVRKFLHAYAVGDALTFVNPRTGELVSATLEARALADACLEGPGAVEYMP